MTRAFRRRTAPWPVVLLLPLLACASAPPPAAIRPAPLPEDPVARELALAQIGRQLYAAVADGVPDRLIVADSQLRSILDADGAMRVITQRSHGSAPGFAAAEQRAAYRQTSYVGTCFDRARFEPAGSTLGLLWDAWVFHRVLLVTRHPDGSRFAAWLEGTFVTTGDLVVALVLSRVEMPRRDHPDLSVLQCDLVDGMRSSGDLPYYCRL